MTPKQSPLWNNAVRNDVYWLTYDVPITPFGNDDSANCGVEYCMAVPFVSITKHSEILWYDC